MLTSVLWWAIPLGVMLAAFGYAFLVPLGKTFDADVMRMGLVFFATLVSLLAWIAGAICK